MVICVEDVQHNGGCVSLFWDPEVLRWIKLEKEHTGSRLLVYRKNNGRGRECRGEESEKAPCGSRNHYAFWVECFLSWFHVMVISGILFDFLCELDVVC